MKTTSFTRKLTIFSLIICYSSVTDASSLLSEQEEFSISSPKTPHSVPAQCEQAALPNVHSAMRPDLFCTMPLCDAVSKGYSLKRLEQYVAGNPELLKKRLSDGFSVLHWIAHHGQEKKPNRREMIKKAKLMLRLNADPNALCNNGETPFQIALRKNYTTLIEILAPLSDPPFLIAKVIEPFPSPATQPTASLPSQHPLHIDDHSSSFPHTHEYHFSSSIPSQYGQAESSFPQPKKRKYLRPKVPSVFGQIKKSTLNDFEQFLIQNPEAVYHRKMQTGYTPLHEIAQQGQKIKDMLAKAMLLLKFSADPLALSTHKKNPQTPLNVARSYENRALYSLLITHIEKKSDLPIAMTTPHSNADLPPHPSRLLHCLNKRENSSKKPDLEKSIMYKKQKTAHATATRQQQCDDEFEDVMKLYKGILKEDAHLFMDTKVDDPLMP